MNIIHHRLTYYIDFGELGLIVFLQEHKNNSYTLQSKESKHQNYASVQMLLSIKLKFNMHIVDPRSSHYINFGVSRRYTFLQNTKKCHTLRSTVSKYLRTF